ncbi:hypothetical protein JL720_10605 [Aureococcus anophagefferens]|nr:hypothetical protein JL720_10605 [Aureococcus anophagefferens]
MTSVAARAATQDELAFLSEFLEPTTGDDSSEESDAELDCSAPAPRSPPPRGGGVAMRQVTRAELRYVLDDAAAPEPERAWSGEAEELSDGDDGAPDSPTLDEAEELSDDDDGGGDGPALAASCCRLAAPRRWLAAVALALGVSAAAPRSRRASGQQPWGPIVDIWARNAWAAWSRGATFVPPSLRGWYLAAPADDAFCAGAASQWACHFLPLSACDEIAESGEDDDARFVRVFSRGNVTVCRGGCDDAALRAAGLAGPPDPRLAAIFAGARGAVDGVAPHDLVGALLQRGVALRPSYRVRHLARPPAVEGPCVFAQIRHGSKTSPQWLAAQDGVVLVDLADYAREARALAPPGQAFTLFVATDDADALRDAPRLDAEDLRRRGAIVIRRRVERGLWTGGRATSMHRGPAELARILATLEAAAAACGGFVGNCASVFAAPTLAPRAAAAALGLDVAARRLSDAPRVGRGHSTSPKERRKRSHEKALPPPPPWLDPLAVAGPLFSPLNATEVCAVKENRQRRARRRVERLLPRGRRRAVPAAGGPAPEGTSTPPLADDVDLVLLAFTANDFALGCAEPATCFARPRAGRFRRPRAAPTVAFVDTALQRVSRTPENLTRADFSERHRALARAVAAPLVESMFWNGGTFRDEAEQRRAAAFLNAYLAPALRVALDAMMGPASWKGFGHYGAAYHEWVAATVFYALVAPAAEREHGAAEAEAAPAAAPAAAAPRACGGDGDALALCHLANEGAASPPPDAALRWAAAFAACASLGRAPATPAPELAGLALFLERARRRGGPRGAAPRVPPAAGPPRRAPRGAAAATDLSSPAKGRFGGTAPASIRAPAGRDAADATLTTSLLGYDVAIPFPLRRAEPPAAAPPGEIDRPEGAVRELAAEEAPALAASR